MSTATDHETIVHENGDAPVAQAEAPAALTCPSCGATAEAGQLMCLECGARLALDYQRAPSWRLPAAIVGVIVLLAGAGVAIALAAVTNDAGNTTAAAPTQTSPVVTPEGSPADTPPTASTPTPATAPTDTAPAATPEGGTPPAEGEIATPEPAPAPAPEGWPPGKSAFTVILASMPTEAAAQDKLEKARAAGISSAAILHSDDFPTLRPGYWVVFDGQYDTSEQANAQAAADRGKGEFTDAYPRFVSKNPDARP